MQLTNSNEQESQARNSMTSFYSTQKQSLYISSLVNTTDDISSPRSIGPNSMYSIEQSAAQQNMKRLQLIMYVKQNMQAVGQNPDSMPSNAE